uniref:INPP5B PH domain-containing protein n=1 Tax=Periophthalmus magnuspinnatus TaxID=409849 RepID=A0A3B3ZKB5_9GOBI
MDQSVAIQETLQGEESCRIAVQCDVLCDDATESRLLGLVQSAEEYIFLYRHRRMAITAEDVVLENIIPISTDFAVVESSPEELAVVADTRIRISFLEYEVELRLPFGSQSRLFLCEVNKVWSVCKSSAQVPKFEWLNKYQQATKEPGSIRQAFAPIGSKITRLSQ